VADGAKCSGDTCDRNCSVMTDALGNVVSDLQPVCNSADNLHCGGFGNASFYRYPSTLFEGSICEPTDIVSHPLHTAFICYPTCRKHTNSNSHFGNRPINSENMLDNFVTQLAVLAAVIFPERFSPCATHMFAISATFACT
jgi:hypothetical protein